MNDSRIIVINSEDKIHYFKNFVEKAMPDVQEDIKEQIEMLRQDEINVMDEEKANYCWCIRQIYRIQKGFISAINALKSKKYEEAWCILDRVDIGISNLENKKCHLGKNGELVDHHIIHMKKKKLYANRYVGTFGTWK